MVICVRYAFQVQVPQYVLMKLMKIANQRLEMVTMIMSYLIKFGFLNFVSRYKMALILHLLIWMELFVCHLTKKVKSRLTIHGLWPKYTSMVILNVATLKVEITKALLPEEVVGWSIWPELKEQWPDRTALPDSPCAVCLMVGLIC